MTSVLVTGGAGYIGSHTCRALFEAGHVPVTYDNLSTGHRNAVRWGPLVEGDILDAGLLAQTIRRYRPEAVIHFAASAYVGESVADPGKYYRNNVAGSLSLLEAMRDNGVGNIVFSSSCAVYGNPASVPISEDCPLAPVNPYGMTKLVVERMLADFGAAHGLSWVALRYFNAAGAEPDGSNGEDHDPETRIVPVAIDAADGRLAHLDVFGTDYPTPDGTCIRDYIHVCDLADAHVKALHAVRRGALGRALNLGTGLDHSVLEVIGEVERATGRKVPVRNVPRRPGDPPELVADAAEARRVIGFEPRHSSIAEIVATATAWRRRKLAHANPGEASRPPL